MSRRPLWDLKHPEDPDWKYEPDEQIPKFEAIPEAIVKIPASTPFPIFLAFGVALAFAGLVTTEIVSLLGVVFVLCGAIGWFRDVLPREKHESLATVASGPVSFDRPEVAEVHPITGNRHRARLPVEIHTVSAGIRGGLAGGAAMAVVVGFWRVLTSHSVWYPANLLAAGFFPERATTAQLVAFHWDSLIAGMAILIVGSVLVGLLYGAILPMVPRFPILVGGVVIPLCAWALAYSILGTVNPLFAARVIWPLFIVSHVASGLVTGIVVSRSERIRTWQHVSFADRAGLEVSGSDEDAHGNR